MSTVFAAAEPPVVAPAHPACVVCGSTGVREVASAGEVEQQRRYLRDFHRRRLREHGPDSLEERAEFTQDYVARIVACTGCGLVFRDPQPSREAVASAYAGDTYGRERLDALYESQLELFRPKARALSRRFGTSRTGARPVVLEIGSFVGGFLAACRELGWDAVGIDPGEEVAAFCESKGLRVLRENVDDVSAPEAAADCIAIWNTFDQLADPRPALRQVSRCLRPGGLAVVRIPDGQCFDACMRVLDRAPRIARGPLLASMAWNNFLSFPYLHGYSPATLDQLFGGYGLERVDLEGDVLTRLADERTKTWASVEERAYKAAWLALSRVARLATGRSTFPWIDVYYRRR